MQHTLFIADLHLDEKHPATYAYFSAFMQKQAPLSEALYILGDLFEKWIGDDHRSPFNELVKADLKRLTQKIPVYFLHGNRDFLIGKKFARETGCHILPEFSIIKLYGQPIILLHGDVLCSLDKKHMRFRKLTKNSLLKTIFLSLPLTTRQKIGSYVRKSSKQHHQTTPNNYLDVIPETVASTFKNYQINKMVHGHIHQPRVFHTIYHNEWRERIVLGSWEQHGCALKWYPHGKREMIFFK
jgi:UDP-2,3-diacylglucosamine hydrolase